MKKAQELHVMPGTIGTRRSGGQLDFRPGLAAVAFPVVPTHSDFVHVDVQLPFPWAGEFSGGSRRMPAGVRGSPSGRTDPASAAPPLRREAFTGDLPVPLRQPVRPRTLERLVQHLPR